MRDRLSSVPASPPRVLVRVWRTGSTWNSAPQRKIGILYRTYDVGPLTQGIQRGLEMKDLRDLKVPASPPRVLVRVWRTCSTWQEAKTHHRALCIVLL